MSSYYRLFQESYLCFAALWLLVQIANSTQVLYFIALCESGHSPLSLIHTYHAVPMPHACHVANELDPVVPISLTQRERVCFTHAMPCPCCAPTKSL
jgi:hypothetical protein